jgi:hypothetical protein
MTNIQTRDGGAPWPYFDGGVAVTIDPVRLPRTPEIRLCQAVLEQALSDLDCARRLPMPRRGPRAAEVISWFRSTDVRWPYSFEAICATLGLDAGAVRQAVLPKSDGSRRSTVLRLILAPTELRISPATAS